MIDNKGIIGYLESGLRAETLRQQAIASNVANSQTPGYRRVDVKFAELMARALERGNIESADVRAELFTPRATPLDSRGNDVDLDSEIGEMVKNTMMQKAYMRILAQKYRQMELAIGSGT